MINSPWLPFFYQYGISSLVFTIGLVMAVRKGTLILSYRHDRWTLAQLILGFLAMMTFHAVMIIAAGV